MCAFVSNSGSVAVLYPKCVVYLVFIFSPSMPCMQCMRMGYCQEHVRPSVRLSVCRGVHCGLTVIDSPIVTIKVK